MVSTLQGEPHSRNFGSYLYPSFSFMYKNFQSHKKELVNLCKTATVVFNVKTSSTHIYHCQAFKNDSIALTPGN